MYAKCIKCGSEKTHRSRVRRGERTVDRFFLRPIRCSECKERFWVRNPNAYFATGGAFTVGALLIGFIGLVIEHNLSDPYIAPAEKGELEQLAISDTAKSQVRDPGEHLNTTNTVDREFAANSQTAFAKSTARPSQNVANDPRLTVQLYQESAKNGNVDAQYKLGLLYLTGNGALQDFAEAAKWLKLAAEQGYGLAQYELGLIYGTGHGLDIDQVQSYVWLNLASAAGVQQAVTARDDVMRSLNPKQLAQAQKISREWLASRLKPKLQASGAPKAVHNDAHPDTRVAQPDTPSPSPSEKSP